MTDVEDSPIEALSAVTLVTPDMAAAVAFYEACGFRAVYGGAGEPFTSMRAGSGYLNLQGGEWSPGDAVWGRPIFWVADVDDLHDRLVAAGYMPDAEPADAPWGERYFHIRDPSGHEISFARLLDH